MVCESILCKHRQSVQSKLQFTVIEFTYMNARIVGYKCLQNFMVAR